MKIADHLSTEQKQQLDNMNTPKKKRKKKKEEKVNWIDIMGMNRDRFGRGRGGALKRK
jgi:hypothetical protein